MNAAPRPRRRTQAERSEAMRARLAAAAFETAAAGGIGALRMRSVADAAGVSQGALLHHFPDKNALVLAAIDQALTLARKDSSNWLQTEATDPRGVLQAMLSEFRAFFFSDRFWVAMAITMEAAKDPGFDPSIRATVASLRKPVYAAWLERLVKAGWDRDSAARTVRSGASLVSGAAIRRFWADQDEVSAQVEQEWLEDRLRGLEQSQAMSGEDQGPDRRD
jgi:AcrR family transcriptional regulator